MKGEDSSVCKWDMYVTVLQQTDRFQQEMGLTYREVPPAVSHLGTRCIHRREMGGERDSGKWRT